MYINWRRDKSAKLIQFFLIARRADSSSDEGSIPEERIATPDREYNYPRDHLSSSREQMKLPSSREHSGRHQSNMSDRSRQNLPPPVMTRLSQSNFSLYTAQSFIYIIYSLYQIHQVPVHRQPYIEFKRIVTI